MNRGVGSNSRRSGHLAVGAALKLYAADVRDPAVEPAKVGVVLMSSAARCFLMGLVRLAVDGAIAEAPAVRPSPQRPTSTRRQRLRSAVRACGESSRQVTGCPLAH
ncbi:hypothetical protein GCM10020221_02590 [Streptomyces thioluteus]|uniref:Uncharacterized protein n=1 Tax=Streptomyces thioluteus TaxID=66431 RepID=A0ABN3WC84_STRTU